MADIEIIPLDHGPGHGPPPPPVHYDMVPPPRSVMDDFHDEFPDSRPGMQQRLSGLNLNDVGRRPSTKRRESSISKPRDKYVYYTLLKEGDDWSKARRRKLPVPQDQLEKLAKKGRKKVLEETRNMGNLRGQHFDLLVADMNKSEIGDATWEPAYITKERITRRNRLEVTSMDVVLARVTNSSKVRSKSTGAGEIIDIADKKSKDKSGKKDKDSGFQDHKRKDSKLEDDDPFGSRPVFHRTGKPMDEYGPMEFANGGLPSEIPRDRPIGHRLEEEKKKDKEKEKEQDKGKGDKGGKRSKSKDSGKLKQGVDDVLAGALGGGPGPLGDSLASILGDHKGGKSRGGSRAGDYPEVMGQQRRSRSRRRPSESRHPGSRSRSRATHPEELRFPPYWERRGGGGGGGGGGAGGYYSTGSSASSVSSDTSRFGLDQNFEGSSHTSQDTYHSVTGRGSRYNDDDRYYKRDPRRDSYSQQEKKAYKEHSRGPPLQRASTYDAYRTSSGTRRYSTNRSAYYQDVIPEQRQIGYRDDPQQQRESAPGPLARRSTYADDGRGKPILHYPNDVASVRDAEGYMSANLRDEELNRREKEVERREREIKNAEWEEEELRRRERERERQREDEELRRRERVRESEETRRYHDDGRDRRYSRGNDYYGDRY